MSNTIVVLVPATAASTLVDSSGLIQVWPAEAILQAELGLEKSALNLLEQTDLHPGHVNPGYAAFVKYFTDRGFAAANAVYAGPGAGVAGWGLPAGPLKQDLVVSFPYDWRADCTASAKVLDDFLTTVDGHYAASGYELFLVAHSMGGLVCRAALETVGKGQAWHARVSALITLGTPHLGAPLALDGVMRQLTGIPLPPVIDNPAGVRTLIYNFVDTSTSASTYELLPPPVLESAETQRPFTQYIQAGGAWYNLLDANAPAGIRAAVAAATSQSVPATRDLTAATNFFATLDYSGTASGALPPYYCVVGASLPTLGGFAFDATAPTPFSSLPSDGDGIVPSWSAGFTGRTTPIAGSYTAEKVSHMVLASNTGVLAQVAAWVGAEPAGAAGRAAA